MKLIDWESTDQDEPATKADVHKLIAAERAAMKAEMAEERAAMKIAIAETKAEFFDKLGDRILLLYQVTAVTALVAMAAITIVILKLL